NRRKGGAGRINSDVVSGQRKSALRRAFFHSGSGKIRDINLLKTHDPSWQNYDLPSCAVRLPVSAPCLSLFAVGTLRKYHEQSGSRAWLQPHEDYFHLTP